MRIKKKGQAGQARNFLTRTQAVRKLQISLPDFRRLCIFKGIYPREPRNTRKASKSSTASTTFYYTKDIQYLLHEPLLAKFRDHKALAKKIARSLGRGEVGDAARLEKRGAGKLSLDHIIKERYPTFVDALRDLDDALSLLFLFANLPSTSTVPPKTIALCQRLCLEFQHYLITTNALRKSFLSIKGIYYQATIQGQDILWLVPYKFVQRVTGDVDFRIMGTFVEFYTTLLGFVNFRLYTTIGLVYPPRFDPKRDEQGAELDAFTLEGRGLDDIAQIEGPTNGQLENGTNGTHELDEETQKKIANLSTKEEPAVEETNEAPPPLEASATDSIDTFTAIAPDADTLPQPASSTDQIASLFAPFTFYISRECPRAPLEFLLRAFGCKRVGWDAVLGPGAFTHDETDPAITHQIVDRPPVAVSAGDASSIEKPEGAEEGRSSGGEAVSVRPGHRIPGRTYVQPQWVWDSVNEVKCLRPDLYAPGATLPPHLSPWVKPSKGEYDPRATLAEQEREGEGAEEEGAVVNGGDHNKDGAVEDGDKLGDEDDDNEDETEEEEDENSAASKATQDPALNATDEDYGMAIAVAEDTDDEDEEEDDFAGFTSPATSSDAAAEEEEEEDPNDDLALLHQKELEAEAAGLPPSLNTTTTTITTSPRKADGTPLKSILKSSSTSTTSGPQTKGGVPVAKRPTTMAMAIQKKRRQAEQAEEEELERRKGMLGNRKRKLYDKMVFANRRRDGEAERLRGKRRRVQGVGSGQ